MKWLQADKKTEIVVSKQWLTSGVDELSSLITAQKPVVSRFVEKKFDKLQIYVGMLPLNAADRLH